MRRLTHDQFRLRALARQFPIISGRGSDAVVELFRRLGPIQSQVPRAPFLTISSRLPGVSYETVCTLFESHRLVKTSNIRGTVHTSVAEQFGCLDAVARATRAGQVRNVLTTIPDLAQKYNGVEFQVNTRLTNATIFGGLTIGRDEGDQDSGDMNNPNVRINNNGAIGFDSTYQVRGGFTYRFPYDMQFSGSIREATGLPQTRVYPVTTSVVPGLTQVTQNVQAVPRGEFRYPWQNLVDLRFTKVFRSGRTRIEPTVDVFNIFNNNATTNVVTTIGSSLGRPSAIVMGRLLRVGGHIAF